MATFFSSLYESMAEQGLNPSIEQLDLINAGIYTVSRVDVNETWHLGSQSDVKAWIRAAGQKLLCLIVVGVCLVVIRYIGAKALSYGF